MKKFSLHTLRFIALVGLLIALLGTVIAFTCRDRWVWSAQIFYATPWFLRLGAGIGGWLMFRGSRRPWLVIAVVCILAAGVEATRSFRFAKEAPPTTVPNEVVLWNASHDLAKHPEEWPRLANASTLLVTIIEAGRFEPAAWQKLCASQPQLQWRQLDNSIVIGTAGEILSAEPYGNKNYMRYRLFRVKIRHQGQVWTIFTADVVSQPWFNREPTLASILQAAGNEPRTIILGDFNTPSQSLFYDHWRKTFTLANEHHTTGFAETWCYGIPLFTIDQIWHSRDVNMSPVKLEHRVPSDHARVRGRILTH